MGASCIRLLCVLHAICKKLCLRLLLQAERKVCKAAFNETPLLCSDQLRPRQHARNKRSMGYIYLRH